MTPEPFDALALGPGAAELMAALRAHDRGATVRVFEKQDYVGGTSASSCAASCAEPLQGCVLRRRGALPGAFGTTAAPDDSHGQLIDVDRNPIPGLYAAGNTMAGVTGMTWRGAGGTLGRE